MLLPLKQQQKVILNLKFADTITVEPWGKNSVFVKAVVNINGGTLNHAHFMDSAFYNDAVEIKSGLNEDVLSDRSFDDCHERNASRHHFNPKDQDARKLCIWIRYTVYLPARTNLEIETITGNLKIQGMTGTVEAKSVTGSVELIIPSNQHADVYLKSVMGRVFSDLEVAVPDQPLKALLSRHLEGKVNGGGKKVRLESVMGDANIRTFN